MSEIEQKRLKEKSQENKEKSYKEHLESLPEMYKQDLIHLDNYGLLEKKAREMLSKSNLEKKHSFQ